MRKTPNPIVPTETISVSEMRKDLANTLRRVEEGEVRYVVERAGRTVGVLVSERDLTAIQTREQQRADAWAALREMRKGFVDVPPDELQAEIDKAVREVKEANLARRRAADRGL